MKKIKALLNVLIEVVLDIFQECYIINLNFIIITLQLLIDGMHHQKYVIIVEIKKNLKLSDRTYICEKCGYINDRDLNAALNIRDY